MLNYYLTDGQVGFYADTMKKSGIPMNIRTVDLVTFSAQWQTNKYEDAAGGSTTGANLVADIFYKDMVRSGSPGNRWNLSDPQIAHRRTWRVRKHPEIGDQAYYYPGIELDETPGDVTAPAPCIGEHNEIVLGLLQQHGVKKLVKSKSMLTEECHLNPFLERHGIDVTDIPIHRRGVGIVFQEPFLMGASVRDNVTMGAHIDDHRVLESLALALEPLANGLFHAARILPRGVRGPRVRVIP